MLGLDTGAAKVSLLWVCAERPSQAPHPMRLFARPARIQLRMSATSICATLAGPATASALTGSASLLFSTFMADDTKSLALGLKRRDPDLLDALIEQYQYRLFRYLLYITGNR